MSFHVRLQLYNCSAYRQSQTVCVIYKFEITVRSDLGPARHSHSRSEVGGLRLAHTTGGGAHWYSTV